MLKTFGARQLKFLKIGGQGFLIAVNSKAPKSYVCTMPDNANEDKPGHPTTKSCSIKTATIWDSSISACTSDENCDGACVCRADMEGSTADFSGSIMPGNAITKPPVQVYKFNLATGYFYELQQLNSENHTFDPRAAEAFEADSCVANDRGFFPSFAS